MASRKAVTKQGGAPSTLSLQFQAPLEHRVKMEKKPCCSKPAEGARRGPRVVQAGNAKELLHRVSPPQIKQEPDEGLAQRWEAQWQEFLKVVQSPQSGWGNSQLPDLMAFSDLKGFQTSRGTAQQAFGRGGAWKVKEEALEEEAGIDSFEEVTMTFPRVQQVCLGASRKQVSSRLLNEHQRPTVRPQDYPEREALCGTSLQKPCENLSHDTGRASKNQPRPERHQGIHPGKRAAEAIPCRVGYEDLSKIIFQERMQENQRQKSQAEVE
uniref:Uncharacterized protein n=1 Tax=Sphaerodactylus townsendi TaxID=933632 RepID=A0ACB8EFT6_9SAUR